jgi:redox-sensitive bicupin YhaK (pirin superfamily)
VVLPDAARDLPRDFAHHVPPEVSLPGGVARVFLGELAGERSPVPVFTPLLGAELTLEAGASMSLQVDPSFEHGVLVDLGPVELDGVPLTRAELGYVAPGTERLALRNPGSEPARVILLGGEPFTEPVLMWWNFVGRTHEEIAAFREDWEQRSDRFGEVKGYAGQPQRLPAPALPNVRIKPRMSPPPAGDRSAWG